MNKSTAGLYVHVPFCFSKCDYCAFYSIVPDAEAFARYFDRLAAEAAQLLSGHQTRIKTVFIGGGNPTALGLDGVKHLVEIIRPYLDAGELEEITFETNPETLTPEIVAFMATLPAIRISMGIQRLDDAELALLGRRARLDSVYRALDTAFSRIGNVGGDLILGVPGCVSTAGKLAELVAKFPLKHVSAYFLTVEDNTPMQRSISAGLMEDPSEIGPEELFEVRDVLVASGFEHYEISNYARPGFRCKHNINYWQAGDYIGLGPSAVSSCAQTRTSNPADLQRWLNGCSPDVERLSNVDCRNEYVMLSLRLPGDGLDLQLLEQNHGQQGKQFAIELAKQIASGNLVRTGNLVRLTDKGLALADGVMSALFI